MQIGEKWTAICPLPEAMKKQAARAITDLRIEAERQSGLRIWTEPLEFCVDKPIGPHWRATGTAIAV